jgi:hypothetical protein
VKYAETIVDLMGNTPLVRLNRVTEGLAPLVLAKVEYLNPGGSVKDRIAVRMIEAAERDGQLKPGGTIVEPTSGNTGVGLALVAQQKGYRCVFVCPDKVGQDKRDVLEAYGAEVVVCPTAVPPDHPDSYYSVSDRLVREIDGAWKPNQYANPEGPASHYETTGPEVWRIPTLPFDLLSSFAFLEDDGSVTLVDCGLKRAPARIVAGLAAIGKAPGDVRRIVLTHAHIDHVGGLAEIRRRASARRSPPPPRPCAARCGPSPTHRG